jgi:opacity protein-like surface antigen
MKKLLLVSLMVVFVFTATSLYAAEKYVLGQGNIALKVDYIYFTDDAFDNIDIKDAVYVGLEGYYALMPNLYLGMEVGWAAPSNDGRVNDINVDLDITYIPVELNLKYAAELAPSWVVDFGAGVSYNYLKVEANHLDADADDWVFGGQVFTDLTYKINNQWSIGINGKYQFTDDLEFDVKGEDIQTNTNANNWRVGAQVGLMF